MTGESATSNVELMGPADGGFYTSNLSDWGAPVPPVEGLLGAPVLDHARTGDRKVGAVRKLSLAEFCYLLPAKPTTEGEFPKPSSLSRIRSLLRELTEVGLITTPEGGRSPHRPVPEPPLTPCGSASTTALTRDTGGLAMPSPCSTKSVGQ